MLFFAIASEAIAQNEINLDKIFTKDNLTELPQFPGGKTCIHHIQWEVDDNGLLLNTILLILNIINYEKDFCFFGIHADISILCMFFFHVRQTGRGIRKFDQRTRFCIQQRRL